MRTVICKYIDGGNVSPLGDSAIGALPTLPPLDRNGITARGRNVGYYIVTNVPAETPIVEVAKRLRNTIIFGVYEMPYSALDDGRGGYGRIVTPKTLDAA